MLGATNVYVGAARYTGGAQGGLFRRSAGTDRWELMTKGLPEPTAVQAITVHPVDPAVVYAGTQEGPYRSRDHGASWERLAFPDKVEVWSIAVHPKNPRILYAGTSPVGVYRSDDGGDSWRKLPGASGMPPRVKMSFACRVMRLAVDPSHPDEVYAALEVGGAMRSTDGGATWADVSEELVKLAERPHLKSQIQSDTHTEGMLDAHALAVSGAEPRNVFLAVRMGLFHSGDQGRHWEDLEIRRFSPLTYGRDIRVSPQDSRTLYACLSPAARSQDGSLYRSQDLGKTWTRFDHGVKANSTMMGVGLHPKNASAVYCVSRFGQVFGTEDGGKTWSESRLPEDVKDVYAIACG